MTKQIAVALVSSVWLASQVSCSGGTVGPAAAGSAGTMGSAGATGSAGSTGAAGATGAAGTTGFAGTTGTAGITGAAGTSGNAGTKGAAGTTGTAGATGAAGTTGTGGGAGAAAGRDGGISDVAIPAQHFSFFVTSIKAMRDLSKNQQGFGGNLSFGETGAGAGLRGADKICSTIAEKSLPGSGQKQWRAFLSAVAGENGSQVNAIDRIGNGPWYDRLGRTFALTKADLLFDRPHNGDPAIVNDFPNEDGVPNHAPDPGQPAVDNHDTLTGTNNQGTLYGPTATCKDWTGSTGSEGKPRVGHTWPRNFGGGGRDGGGTNGANWMSALDESGCAPGINLVDMGGPMMGSNTVGSGGGYGGIYCFALVP
jgi:Collagen triple helix repeat (20 copies)